MGIWTKILLIVILVHFVGGFGYLIIKLSPKKKDVIDEDAKQDELSQ